MPTRPISSALRSSTAWVEAAISSATPTSRCLCARQPPKGGRISTIVPMCSHMDHSEHSVQVVVTEQGLADLRGLSPRARAMRIIENCAHPAYRDALHRYLQAAPMGHIRHDLRHCFDMHLNYLEHDVMLPDLNLAQFGPHHVPAADKD